MFFHAQLLLPDAGSGPLDFRKYIVMNPFFIPPFDRINEGIINQHAEMQVIASGQSCHAGSA
jgi:hypothetical protein